MQTINLNKVKKLDEYKYKFLYSEEIAIEKLTQELLSETLEELHNGLQIIYDPETREVKLNVQLEHDSTDYYSMYKETEKQVSFHKDLNSKLESYIAKIESTLLNKDSRIAELESNLVQSQSAYTRSRKYFGYSFAILFLFVLVIYFICK